jgi:hypothetical protein
VLADAIELVHSREDELVSSRGIRFIPHPTPPPHRRVNSVESDNLKKACNLVNATGNDTVITLYPAFLWAGLTPPTLLNPASQRLLSIATSPALGNVESDDWFDKNEWIKRSGCNELEIYDLDEDTDNPPSADEIMSIVGDLMGTAAGMQVYNIIYDRGPDGRISNRRVIENSSDKLYKFVYDKQYDSLQDAIIHPSRCDRVGGRLM